MAFTLWYKTVIALQREKRGNIAHFTTIVVYGTEIRDLHRGHIFCFKRTVNLKWRTIMRFEESKKNNKKTFTPMDPPQPASDSIVELIRNYSVLKKDSQYKRNRLVW